MTAMLDWLPARFWLVVLIAMIAFVPARQVFAHIVAARGRRDLLRRPEAGGNKTDGRLARNICVLVALLAVTIFIFTPAAERFARSPSFLPLLFGGLGAWALYTVAGAIVCGEIQPLSRGVSGIYTRTDHPKRFWASAIWNAAIGCACLWAAIASGSDAFEETANYDCLYSESEATPQQALAACNRLLDHSSSPNLILARGVAYHRMGDYTHAIADYSEAIRLKPDYGFAYYKRAEAFAATGDAQRAAADREIAKRLPPVIVVVPVR